MVAGFCTLGGLLGRPLDAAELPAATGAPDLLPAWSPIPRGQSGARLPAGVGPRRSWGHPLEPHVTLASTASWLRVACVRNQQHWGKGCYSIFKEFKSNPRQPKYRVLNNNVDHPYLTLNVAYCMYKFLLSPSF